MKNKKAQQEIIGFVLIVLIVVIILVIFLSIYLSKDSAETYESLELEKFIDASLRITSNCSKDYSANVLELRDLVDLCIGNSNEKCLDGREFCQVLETDYTNLLNLDQTYAVGEKSPIKYHKFWAYYQENLTDPTTKLPDAISIDQGNSSICSIKRTGKRELHSSFVDGWNVIKIQVCSVETD